MDEHTQKLISYIQQQLQSGQTPDEISGQLTAAGWPIEQIHQAFLTVQSQTVPTAMQSTETAAAVVPQANGKRRGRVGTGWLLFKQSVKLLNGNRYLFRFLLMSWLTILVIEAVLFLFVFFAFRVLSHADGSENTWWYVFAFFSYLIIYFVINFYTAALSANIFDIFQGQRRPYAQYIASARAKAKPIFVFSLIQSVVGMFLEYVVERIRFVGWIIAWLLGTAWSLGTMFTLPIIMNSDASATGAIKQSITFFKQTWGENVVAKATVNVPLALIGFAIQLPIGVLILLAAMSGSVALLIGVLIVYVFVVVSLAMFGSFANNIVNMALYYYAAKRELPPGFTSDMLNNVFRERKLFKHKQSNTPETAV